MQMMAEYKQEDMTTEQIVLMDFFQTVRDLSKGVHNAENLISIRIAHLLKSFPYASEVKSQIINGEIILVDADEKIKDIIGYDPIEIIGKPLTFIETGEAPASKRGKIFEDLHKYGVSVKQNINKCKDGSSVETFGWLFKVAPNNYREVVMKKEHLR